MAFYAIGDIQGCYDALCRLLDAVRFDPATDRLWLTGDLVNRGPSSLAVLRFVKKLGSLATSVLGNHDLHLLAVAAGVEAPRPGDTFDELLGAPDRDELLTWLRGRPLFSRCDTLGCVLVHAGLLPAWPVEQAEALAREVETVLRERPEELLQNMYGDRPNNWSPELKGWDRVRVIINAFTRLRYCDQNGKMRLRYKGPPNSGAKDLIPWFALRSDEPYRFVFGHWSALGSGTFANAICLDSGCVWGGRLTAARLDAPNVAFHQVSCNAGGARVGNGR